jgi:hypothetical protein
VEGHRSAERGGQMKNLLESCLPWDQTFYLKTGEVVGPS